MTAAVKATARAEPEGYPARQEVDVALRDGSTLRIRPVRREDRPAIQAFLEGLSLRSVGFRFFGQVNLDWAADWAIDVDYADRHALVAIGPGRAVVAHAAYI